jgi:hypothetical protein
MTNNDFYKLFELVITQSKATLIKKGEEYSIDSDKLINFKDGSRMLNISPEHYLICLMTKHICSIFNIVQKSEQNLIVSEELLWEKFIDAINYLILLLALIKDKHENTQ